MTRLGAVVRADALSRLNEQGCAALEAYGIRTIVDLRVAVELRDDPSPFAQHSAITAHHLPLDPNERIFVTIASGDSTLPLMERVQTIYPRYLVPQPAAGFPGLTYRGFRDDTPYQGEDLVFESNAPEHFLARCSRKGVTSSGVCLLERRIGNADITFRFPRDWLPDWQNVAGGIDRLIARLHPG